MYEFNYELTREDLIQYSITHYFEAPVNEKLRKRERLIMPLVLVIVSSMAFLIMDDEPIYVPLFFGSIMIVLGIIVFVQFKKNVISNTRKRYHQMSQFGKLPTSKKNYLIFHPNYLMKSTDIGEAKIFYTVFEQLIEGEEAFYLYINVMQAIILPYRAFSTDEEKTSFKAFIQSKICLASVETR